MSAEIISFEDKLWEKAAREMPQCELERISGSPTYKIPMNQMVTFDMTKEEVDACEEIMEAFHEKSTRILNQAFNDIYKEYLNAFARLCDEVERG